MGLKREITLLASVKGFEDLYHITNVCLVNTHCLNGLSKGACLLDGCEGLGDALLNAMKHQRDDV